MTERVPGARSVAYGAWVGVGSRDESLPLAGASHFLEHLLFKGTPTRSTNAIAEAIDAMGGDMNAFTAREHTGFHVKCLEEDGPEALGILTDIMSAPVIDANDVEVERGVIIEEILERNDEPADWVHDLVLSAAYPDSPVGRDVLGSEESIEAMSRDDIANFFASNYGPTNVVLAAAGAVDHETLVTAGERMVAAGPSPSAAPLRTAPVVPGATVVVDHQNNEQVQLCVALPTVSLASEERFAVAVVDQLLGGGLSSRLFQEVREKRGLAYSIYTYRTLFVDAGVMVISAGTAPSKVGETLEVIGAELERLANDGVNERELDIARRHLVGAFELALEDTGARMGRIAATQLTYGAVDNVVDAADRIRSVTLDDVARAAAALASAPRSLLSWGQSRSRR